MVPSSRPCAVNMTDIPGMLLDPESVGMVNSTVLESGKSTFGRFPCTAVVGQVTFSLEV